MKKVMERLNGVRYDEVMEKVTNAFDGISFNEKKWGLKQIPGGICLVQKDLWEFYNFTCGIFALQQCTEYDDVFIIHYQSEPEDEYTIALVKLSQGKCEFLEYFTYKTVDFLSQRVLLLDRNSLDAQKVFFYDSHRFDLVGGFRYTIDIASRNRGIPTPDKSLCDGRKIHLLYGTVDQYPTYLKVEYELSTALLKEYVQILLNPTTLELVSQPYSTIRGKFVPLTEDYTLYDLITEDRKHLRTASSFLFQIYGSDGRISDDELLANIESH